MEEPNDDGDNGPYSLIAISKSKEFWKSKLFIVNLAGESDLN